VLDYDLVTSATNFSFNCQTYLVSGTVNLAGTTTLSGGAVIKYIATNTAQINVNGPLVCLSSPYWPATFTSSSDNTVGSTISGSTGTPANYGGYALYLDSSSSGSAYTLQNVRVAYANVGIGFHSYSYYLHTLSHAQFTKCPTALLVYSGEARIRNLLAYDIGMLINYYGATVRCEHVTAYKASQLATTQSPTNIYMTNCILAQVTNIGNFYGPGYIGSYVAITNDGSAVFQTVGAGNCYLAPYSSWRGYGTTSITPSLLADLRKRTTYPPIVRPTISPTSRCSTPKPCVTPTARLSTLAGIMTRLTTAGRASTSPIMPRSS